MEKNGNNKGLTELWGHEFKRVKSGLDEEQVASFVNELVSERDTLLKRQEHLSSLSELAERTVAEADNVAKEIKEEAAEQAKAEANAIIARAEEQVQQIIEEKRAEAIAMGEKEAEVIKADARKQAESLLEEKTRKVELELRDTAQRLYRELLSQLENLKQQVTEMETNYGETITSFQPVRPDDPTVIEEENSLNTGTAAEVSPEAGNSILAEALATDAGELEKGVPVSADNQETTEYGVEVKLEIMPPIDISKIMGVMTHLDSLPEVETTELVPLTDKPLIMVALREPLPLTEILKTLSEVGQAKEVADGDKGRKIEVTLSGSSVLDDTKERLNNQIPHILSS
jgi:cell division septum initiation protein DivIVA